MSRRILAWGALGILLVVPAGPAAAQVAPPPDLAVVLEPLVSAAEADYAAGRPGLALARLGVALGGLPEGSVVRVRAQALAQLVTSAGVVPDAVGLDVLLAPLVDAAERDGTTGALALGRARLDFVLQRVDPSSALAVRARGLAGASATIGSGAGTGPNGPTGPIVPPPGYGYSGAVITPAGPTVVPPVAPIDPELAPGATPLAASETPGRRGTGELVELYITMAGYGAWTGAYVPLVTGWATATAPGEESRFYTLSCVLTAGAFMLIPFGLDQIDQGIPTGVPTAISMGLRYGLAAAAAGLGAGGGEVHGNDIPHLLWWTGIGGGALGALIGYTARPHPAQVQFVQTGGLWGALLGTFSAVLLYPAARPADQSQVAFSIGLGGFLGGLTITTIMSAVHENPSARRSWLSTLGLVAGAGAGTVIWSFISVVTDDFDPQIWGGAAALGSIGGLIIALVLTSGDRDPTGSSSEEPEISMNVSPTNGGGMFSIDGRF